MPQLCRSVSICVEMRRFDVEMGESEPCGAPKRASDCDQMGPQWCEYVDIMHGVFQCALE